MLLAYLLSVLRRDLEINVGFFPAFIYNVLSKDLFVTTKIAEIAFVIFFFTKVSKETIISS